MPTSAFPRRLAALAALASAAALFALARSGGEERLPAVAPGAAPAVAQAPAPARPELAAEPAGERAPEVETAPTAGGDDARRWVRFVDPLERPLTGVRVATGSRERLQLALRRGPLLPWQPPAQAEVESDAAGLAGIALDPSRPWAVAWGDTVAPIVFAVNAGGTEASAPLVLVLQRAAGVEVLVTDANGDPKSGVGVTLHFDGRALERPEGSLDLPRLGWRGATGEDGRVTVAGLPPEVELTVRFELAGEAPTTLPEPLVLESGELRALRWTHGAGATLRGTLLAPTGAGPLADYTIWLLPAPEPNDGLLDVRRRPMRTTRTDEAGVFVFEHLPPGGWWVGPSPSAASPWERNPPEAAVAAVARYVRVEAGDELVEITIVATVGCVIEGRVVDTDGEPFPEADVRMMRGRLAGALDVPTDDDGAFRLFPIAAGDYAFRARAPGGPWGETVTVAAGALDARVAAARVASLRVEIVDAGTGEPAVASEFLIASWEDGSRLPTVGTAQHTFVIRDVPYGRYDVLALTGDGRGGLESASVDDFDAEVTIAVHPVGQVTLRYGGPEKAMRFDVGWHVGTHTTWFREGVVERGLETIVNLPPGYFGVRRRGASNGWGIGVHSGEERVIDLAEER